MRPDARLEIPIPFPVRAFISNGMSWRTCLPDRFCRFNKTALLVTVVLAKKTNLPVTVVGSIAAYAALRAGAAALGVV